MLYRAILFVLVMTLGACASSKPMLEVSPLVFQNQKMVDLDGQRTVQSEGEAVTVWASTEESPDPDSEHMKIYLSFENRSGVDVDIIPGKFAARDQSGETIEILTPAELQVTLDEIYKGRRANVDGHNMGAPFQNTGAGIHTGTLGSDNYSGELQHAGAARGTDRTEANIAREMDSYLRRQTLSPGGDQTGKIWLELSAEQVTETRITLDVAIADETHTFLFLAKTISPGQ